MFYPTTLFGVSVRKVAICICAVGLFIYLYLVQILTIKIEINVLKNSINRFEDINLATTESETILFHTADVNKGDVQLYFLKGKSDIATNTDKDNLETNTPQYESDEVNLIEHNKNILQDSATVTVNANTDNIQTNIIRDEINKLRNFNKDNKKSITTQDENDRIDMKVDNILFFQEDRTNILQNKRNEKVKSIDDDMKYILQWTPANKAPFYIMGSETSIFTRLKCKFKNCYVTENRAFFDDVTDFDSIAFNGRDVTNMKPQEFPLRRSSKQKYIYGAMESAYLYPACEPMLDNYFNWTWTYKLDSDFRWGYFTIYDLKGSVIGPAIDMKWPAVMEPLGEKLQEKLASKTKAVAWFVSNCRSKNGRLKFAEEIETELKEYGWSVDIYGACGTHTCPKQTEECDEMIETDYYFYFSFENSFAEDYVTEKLTTALKNFAVPIVYGGANYSRFLPPGSYLNGRELGAKRLAETMNEIMLNRTMYYDFHRWRNHLKYVNNNENNSFCKLCAALNDRTAMEVVTVKQNFRNWWNGKLAKCEVS